MCEKPRSPFQEPSFKDAAQHCAENHRDELEVLREIAEELADVANRHISGNHPDFRAVARWMRYTREHPRKAAAPQRPN
jgi:hypothetical protein